MHQVVERLARLERRVDELQSRPAVDGDGSPQTWLSRAGMFKDDPNFWAAVKAGEEYRKADKPQRKKRAAKPRG